MLDVIWLRFFNLIVFYHLITNLYNFDFKKVSFKNKNLENNWSRPLGKQKNWDWILAVEKNVANFIRTSNWPSELL